MSGRIRRIRNEARSIRTQMEGPRNTYESNA